MMEPVVLLIEDNEDDVFIFRRSLRKAYSSCTVHHVKSGQAAMDYLSGGGNYTNREQYPFPAVVVLDLNLLLVSGFEVLTWARQHPEFKDLPIVVLTGSVRPGDKQRAQELGATQFFEKSPRATELYNYLHALLHQSPVAGR